MFKNNFICFCLIVACRAQIPYFGSCPAIAAKQNFDVVAYLGKWYEAEKYFAVFQVGGKCVSATYSSTYPGVVTVFNQQLNILTNAPKTITGTATFAGLPTDARLNVVFPSAPFVAPYWVLETDYKNFAVVYSCTNIGPFFNFRFVWLLTRAQIPSPEIMQLAYTVLETNHLSRTFLLKTDQKNCPINY